MKAVWVDYCYGSGATLIAGGHRVSVNYKSYREANKLSVWTAAVPGFKVTEHVSSAEARATCERRLRKLLQKGLDDLTP